jgi:hypothetical protein
MSKGLTSYSAALEDGRICHLYDWGGKRFRVVDDAENVLTLIDLFKNEMLLPEVKYNILMDRLFPDPERVAEAIGDNLGELLSALLWDVAGLDITGAHKAEHQKPLFDWEQDATAIRVTLLTAYNLRWDDAKNRISYEELCDLIGMSPHDTPMGQALYYRTAPEPERTKHNGAEVERFRKARDFWKLRNKNKTAIDPMEDANNRANDAFAAFAKVANDV